MDYSVIALIAFWLIGFGIGMWVGVRAAKAEAADLYRTREAAHKKRKKKEETADENFKDWMSGQEDRQGPKPSNTDQEFMERL